MPGIIEDDTLVVSNTLDADGLYAVYLQASKWLESYGLLLVADTAAFQQTAVNQENEDSAQGGN